MRNKLLLALAGTLVLVLMTWLWHKTRSVSPEDHARVDSALRELKSLDRTINQDVLRARYQLVGTYQPVLQSYRRAEELEAILARPPSYLDEGTRLRLADAVADYRAAVTAKQASIEMFKYRGADLKELLAYLPGAGTGVAKAATEDGDSRLAADVNHILQETLLYNLTSDESYAPIIRRELDALSVASAEAHGYGVKRRIRTFVLNVRTLLVVKPEVDRLLRLIFEAPIAAHEEKVAAIYAGGYAAAERTAGRYRAGLYALCLSLLGLVAFGVHRLRRTAQALAVSNERLEERVVERTRELDSRNQEMRAVFDNIDQALFTVDLEGHVSRERSAAFDAWFPTAAGDTHFWSMIGAIDAKTAEWIRLGWDELREDIMPRELIIEQLPRALTVDKRHYTIDYRMIGESGGAAKILVVVSDVTERFEHARQALDQQEQLVTFQQMMKDRQGFLEFFAESEQLVRAAMASEGNDGGARFRAIHTLKGNSGLFGIASLASVCHEIESHLIENNNTLTFEDRERLERAWTGFSDKVRALTETSQGERVELVRTEFQSFRQAVLAGKSTTVLLHLLRRMESEPAERRLSRLGDQAKILGRRMNKGDIIVTTEANDIRLNSTRWAPFWAAFVHMLRNALDHGIEPPSERETLGKPSAGHLMLRTRQVDEQIIVEIGDDGRGIDWAAVRAKAEERGLPARSEGDLLMALLMGGLSTKSQVSAYSGRGVGVSACYRACIALGGEMTVTTKLGEGTTFRFSIPANDTAYGEMVTGTSLRSDALISLRPTAKRA